MKVRLAFLNLTPNHAATNVDRIEWTKAVGIGRTNGVRVVTVAPSLTGWEERSVHMTIILGLQTETIEEMAGAATWTQALILETTATKGHGIHIVKGTTIETTDKGTTTALPHRPAVMPELRETVGVHLPEEKRTVLRPQLRRVARERTTESDGQRGVALLRAREKRSLGKQAPVRDQALAAPMRRLLFSPLAFQ